MGIFGCIVLTAGGAGLLAERAVRAYQLPISMHDNDNGNDVAGNDHLSFICKIWF